MKIEHDAATRFDFTVRDFRGIHVIPSDSMGQATHCRMWGRIGEMAPPSAALRMSGALPGK